MKWEPDKYADDGDGPARDPTPDESAGAKVLGPHAAEVAGLYANITMIGTPRNPAAIRRRRCTFEQDNEACR